MLITRNQKVQHQNVHYINVSMKNHHLNLHYLTISMWKFNTFRNSKNTIHLYQKQQIYCDFNVPISGIAQGWGRTRVWLHDILHALFLRGP